jgi:DNA-binding transcriptional LysR family regulator
MDRLAAMLAFVRVVEAGSFSAAARQLNIGQPAVSRSIAQLERRMGVRLLSRTTHGLTPTEAGRNFCERARRAVEEADEAESSARSAGAGLTGCLRVSAGTTFGSLHLVPCLPFFLAEHPNVSIDLVLEDRPIDLVAEGIDIGLRIGPLRNSSQTVCKLASSRRLVVGAPAYFDRVGIPKTPAQLTDHAAVICTHDCSPGESYSFRRGSSHVRVRMAGRLRVSAGEAVRAAVIAGMGLAVTSEWLFASELAGGVVRPALTEWTLPPADLWLVFPTGRAVSAKARAFATFAKSALVKRSVAREPGVKSSLDERGTNMFSGERGASDVEHPAETRRPRHEYATCA